MRMPRSPARLLARRGAGGGLLDARAAPPTMERSRGEGAGGPSRGWIDMDGKKATGTAVVTESAAQAVLR
ncbi:MAG TPA: hypothetical protein VF904_19560, partial [Anaeromyxobacteraceae bacterium]